MQRCSVSNDRPPGGLCTIYWAWYTIDHERVSRKVHYCTGCFEAHIAPTLGRSFATPANEWYDTCLSCGTSIDGEGAIIYGTAYPPDAEPCRFEWWFCFPCFDRTRHELGSLGTRLQDRQIATVTTRTRGQWLQLIPELAP